jgi:hypothetical protein
MLKSLIHWVFNLVRRTSIHHNHEKVLSFVIIKFSSYKIKLLSLSEFKETKKSKFKNKKLVLDIWIIRRVFVFLAKN